MGQAIKYFPKVTNDTRCDIISLSFEVGEFLNQKCHCSAVFYLQFRYCHCRYREFRYRERGTVRFFLDYGKMGPTDKISRQNVIRAASMFKWTHIQTALELQSSLTNAVTLPQMTNETSAISFHLPDQPCSMLETFFYKSIIAQRFLSATTTDLQLQDGVWRWFQGLWPTGRSDRSRNFK